MTKSVTLDHANAAGVEQVRSRNHPWVLLPLIILTTAVLLAGLFEFVARRILTSNGKLGEDCMVLSDPASGPRGIPNCVCVEKTFEGIPTEYRFNSSGFRNEINFGPKLPGVYRITMIGTSVAAGFRVPEARTFGALLPGEVSRLTGQKTELYNEGLPWRSPQMIVHYFDRDVVWTKPDLVLWILTPEDIKRSDWDVQHLAVIRTLSMREKIWYYLKSSSGGSSITAPVAELLKHTRSAELLSELLYRSPNLYVKSALLKSVEDTDYLKNASHAELLQKLDRSVAEAEQEARKTGIPVIVALVPDRTQVSMVAMGTWPPGFNPYKLGDEIRPIVEGHGWIFIDMLPDYKTVPDPQLGYFAIDGHPNAAGNATIAMFLAREVASYAIHPQQGPARKDVSVARGNQ